jgi:hypothetical protein
MSWTFTTGSPFWVITGICLREAKFRRLALLGKGR